MRNLLKYLNKLLLLQAVVMTACGNDLAREESLQGKAVYLMVDADKGGHSVTRGLTSDVEAVWDKDDRVTVFRASGGDPIGVMSPTTTGSSATTLRAVLTEEVSVDEPLTLVFPRSERDYTGQTGTLADIAAKYDYAQADVTVKYADGFAASATDALFVNQQAILRFSLQNGDTPVYATSLTISAAGLKTSDSTTGDITITPESASSEIYAALSGVNGVVTLTATDGTTDYTYTTADAITFSDGCYYPITVMLKSETSPDPGTPLTLEALEDGTITFVNNSEGRVEYCRNEGDWRTLSGTISVRSGDIISFRGDNPSYYPGSDGSNISCTAECYIYGNIMSLVSSTDYELLTSLSESNTFRGLFEDNTAIRNHPEKELLLPATTLQANCYESMFAGCTGLTRAPVLPAERLRGSCYAFMFDGCTRLNYIKCLATELSANNCTANWVRNVADKGTFVMAADAYWERGNSGIPYNWSIE